MSTRFEQQVLSELNKFRSNPKSIQHHCEVIHKGFSRLKSNDPFLEEIQGFIRTLQNTNPMPTLEYNEALSASAHEQLELFLADEEYQRIQDSRDLKGKVPDRYLVANPNLIADEGFDEPVNVVTKVLLNKFDKFKQGRIMLTDPSFTQIGMAHTIKDGDNYIVLIFATMAISDEPEYEIPNADLTELKKAFDILDVDGNQRLNMKETMSIMRSMNFEKTDPTLYSIFLDLADKPYCSWPKFAYFAHKRMTDRASKRGLETIFNLFIDDPEKKTITFDTFKKICDEIGAGIPDDKLKEILKQSTLNGNEITYKEFENYMFDENQEPDYNITTSTNKVVTQTTYVTTTSKSSGGTVTTTTTTVKKKNQSYKKK